MSRSDAWRQLRDETVSLSDFELLQALGRGSSGTVYLARHLATGALAAIKRLDLEWADEAARMRFHREGRVLARLEHPNIVRLWDVVDDDRHLFLVTEYVPGVTLGELVARQPLRPDDSLAVIAQVADALSYAHHRGVVHRDVSSSNVIVSRAGECKLTDFGLARIVEGTISPSLMAFRTTSGAILGTPDFMSPEAAQGDPRATGPWSDLYSLGVVAYLLLVGRLPFPSGPNLFASLEAHRSRLPPAPGAVAPGFPKALEAALRCALEKDPRSRQPDVAAFRSALERAGEMVWPGWQGRADLSVAVRNHEARRDHEAHPRAGSDTGAVARSGDSPAVIPDTFLGSRVRSPVYVPRKRHRWAGWILSAAVGAGVALAILLAIAIH